MEGILKALVEPRRRQILALVRERELSAGSIARHFRITRPGISQHLTVLKDAGLLSERRQGTRRFYRVDPRALGALKRFLDDYSVVRHDVADDRDVFGERVSVERRLTVPMTPERLWDLLVDADLATRWMGLSASFDLRVGGRYRVEVLPGLVAAGEYLEIERPRRIVHTWGWEQDDGGPVPPGSTTVIFELSGGHEETLLRVRHLDLPSIETAGSHSRGWAHYLARLEAIASGRQPGPDPWVNHPDRMRRELRPTAGGSSPARRKGRRA